MFAGALKQDLRYIAEEIGEVVTDDLKVSDLKSLITKNEQFIKDPEFVKSFAASVIANRK
jgi:hypothetical protein